MKTSLLTEYMEFARDTAYAAGQLTRKYFQQGIGVDIKQDGSPVTQADRESEQLIRTAIAQRYPDHAILGEEYGDSQLQGVSCRWIIDPIDGTRSFIRGVPLYGVLVGLEIDGVIEVGAVCYPPLNEMLWAATGLGCWWNGKPTQVSTVERLEDALLSSTDPGAFRKLGSEATYQRLSARVRQQAGWGDAYGYLLVATGRIEIMLDPIMAIWDCGPFPVILREAGGFFGDWQGKSTIYGGRGLATSQKLLPAVLEALNE